MDVESSTSEILSNKNQAIIRGEYYHHIGGRYLKMMLKYRKIKLSHLLAKIGEKQENPWIYIQSPASQINPSLLFSC